MASNRSVNNKTAKTATTTETTTPPSSFESTTTAAFKICLSNNSNLTTEIGRLLL